MGNTHVYSVHQMAHHTLFHTTANNCFTTSLSMPLSTIFRQFLFSVSHFSFLSFLRVPLVTKFGFERSVRDLVGMTPCNHASASEEPTAYILMSTIHSLQFVLRVTLLDNPATLFLTETR